MSLKLACFFIEVHVVLTFYALYKFYEILWVCHHTSNVPGHLFLSRSVHFYHIVWWLCFLSHSSSWSPLYNITLFKCMAGEIWASCVLMFVFLSDEACRRPVSAGDCLSMTGMLVRALWVWDEVVLYSMCSFSPMYPIRCPSLPFPRWSLPTSGVPTHFSFILHRQWSTSHFFLHT